MLTVNQVSICVIPPYGNKFPHMSPQIFTTAVDELMPLKEDYLHSES